MAFEPLTPILEIGKELITRLWPNPLERDKAQIELFRLAQEGQLSDLKARYEAIVSEAKSNDPWTSRARPSFLYVIYLMILSAVPMGILTAFDPPLAKAISQGMQQWLASIPESLWVLFGAGYLGYTGSVQRKVLGWVKGNK